MAFKYFSGILVVALCLALVTSARAKNLQSTAGEAAVGIGRAAIALVAAVIVVAVHYSTKRSITGYVVASGFRESRYSNRPAPELASCARPFTCREADCETANTSMRKSDKAIVWTV